MDPTPYHSLSDDTKAIISAINNISSQNAKQLDEIERKVNAIKTSAFPEGDADGHRRYHEAVIERMEQRNAMYREIKLHLAKAGLFGAGSIIIYTIGKALVEYLRKWVEHV